MAEDDVMVSTVGGAGSFSNQTVENAVNSPP
jgi:hypothetical protein